VDFERDTTEKLKIVQGCPSFDDPCVQRPCGEHGQCKSATGTSSELGFTCHCEPGYSGPNCTESEFYFQLVFPLKLFD